MERDNEEQIHRLRNRDKSDAAKIAWKKYHSNYMRGIRRRERNKMNKTFYGISKQLEELLESQIDKDNVFDYECEITFDNIAGGVSLKVDSETKNISMSCLMSEQGTGNYQLETTPDDDVYKSLYTDLKDELSTLCQSFDDNIKQILAAHGLKSTK